MVQIRLPIFPAPPKHFRQSSSGSHNSESPELLDSLCLDSEKVRPIRRVRSKKAIHQMNLPTGSFITEISLLFITNILS